MTFRDEEIRVDLDHDYLADGLTVMCPNGHAEFMHPQMAAPEDEPFWCGECGHVFGTWAEVHRRLFVGGAMLEEALARKP